MEISALKKVASMTVIPSNDPKFTLRHAGANDAGLIHQFLLKLATYQKMADDITSTSDSIQKLLEANQGEAVFAIHEGMAVGFMFFSQTSSVFSGRWGYFLDAFYIDEKLRGGGLGKLMMTYLSRYTLARGGQMLEWVCLDWNAPAIRFYEDLGAYRLDELTTYRLSPDRMRQMAEQD